MTRQHLNSVLEEISHLIVCGIIFLTPIFFIPSPFLQERAKFFLFFIGSLIVFLIFLSRVILRRDFGIPKHETIGALFVYFMLALAAAVFSVYPFGSFWGVNGNASNSFLTILAAVVFSIVVIELAQDRKRLFTYVLLFLLANFVVLLFSVLQIFGVFLLPWRHVAVQSFVLVGAGRQLAIYLFAGGIFSLALFYYADEIKQISKIVWVVKCFLILNALGGILAVLYIKDTTTYILAAALFFVLLIVSVLRARRYSSFWLFLPAVMFCIFILTIFVDLPWRSVLPPDNLNPGLSESISIIKQSLNERPFLGFGQSSYKIVYSRFFSPQSLLSPFWGIELKQSFSYITTILTDMGILGLVGWIVFSVSVLVAVVKRFIEEHFKNQMFFAGIALCWLVIFFAQFYMNLSMSLIFILWFTFAIIIAWITGEEKKEMMFKSSFVAHIVIPSSYILGVAILIILFFSGRMVVGELFYARAVDLAARSGNEEKIFKALSLAGSLNNYDDRILRFQSEYAMRRVSEAFFAAKAIDSAKKAVDLNEGDPVNFSRLAEAYSLFATFVPGADDLAINNWVAAVKLSPNNPFTRAKLASSYVVKFKNSSSNDNSGTVEAKDLINKALQEIEKAKELKPKDSTILAESGFINVLIGKKDEAYKAFAEALSYGNIKPEYKYQFALLNIDSENFALAAEILDVVIAELPRFANAWWYRALLYEKEGRIEETAALLIKVTELDPSNKAAVERLKQLTSNRL